MLMLMQKTKKKPLKCVWKKIVCTLRKIAFYSNWEPENNTLMKTIKLSRDIFNRAPDCSSNFNRQYTVFVRFYLSPKAFQIDKTLSFFLSFNYKLLTKEYFFCRPSYCLDMRRKQCKNNWIIPGVNYSEGTVCKTL